MAETTSTASARARGFLDIWDHYLGDVPDRDGQIARFRNDMLAVLDELEQPAPRIPVVVGTGMPATSHLEAYGQTLREAFGVMPYHVGSSIQGKTWRDVDVRVMLDDDRFDALFPGYSTWAQRDAWWSLVCAGIAELGRVRTGLPVDFQIQRTTEANAAFPGPRNALFVARAEDDHRPAMRSGPDACDDDVDDVLGAVDDD